MQFATPTSGLLVRPHARRPVHSLPQKIVAFLFGVPGLPTAAILTALGVALFVILEILTMLAAAIWSVSGYLHLPETMSWSLGSLLLVPSLWVCWKVVKLSLEAERDDAAA